MKSHTIQKKCIQKRIIEYLNGIVVMQVSGWGNAYGHTTLWSGEEQRFIDGTDYLIDGGTNVVVTKFYFWTLDNKKNNISNIAIV